MKNLTRYDVTIINDGKAFVFEPHGNGTVIMYDEAMKYMDERFKSLESAQESMHSEIKHIRSAVVELLIGVKSGEYVGYPGKYHVGE